MKTSELTDVLLDYWTARAEGFRFYHEARGLRDAYIACVFQMPGDREPWMSTRDWKAAKERYTEVFTFADLKIGFHGMGVPRYSSDWAQGGPIIARARMNFATIGTGPAGKNGKAPIVAIPEDTGRAMEGPTHLIAAMRAFVASKFGDEVPESHEAAQPAAE